MFFEIIALVVTIAASVAIPAFADSNEWAFVSNDHASYSVQRSVDAQDGEHLVVIDASTLKHPLEGIDEYRRYGPFRPNGYVYQSVDAKSYISKHLHISGFARGIKPNFSEIEKQFSNYYEGAEQVRLAKFLNAFKEEDQPNATVRFNEYNEGVYEAKLLEFKQFIRSSYENSEYGISVLLDMGDVSRGGRDIRIHAPTSSGERGLNDLWHRFNVEVSIPQGCQSISIVLWQKGVAISEFDHLVISEQGDAIEKNSYGLRLREEVLVEKIIEKVDLETAFSNLSFE